MECSCEHIELAVTESRPTKGGPPAWLLDEVLTNPHRKIWPCYNADAWTDYLVKSKQRKRDLKFVSSLYRSGSFTAVDDELGRYKLDLVGVQKVRWDKGGVVRAGHYIFSM
jgi:hypothetical protein